MNGKRYREIRRIAWSGRGKITRVEVSIDDGQTWQEAPLHGPDLLIFHTRFSRDWEWDGTESLLLSRCFDETGYVQPSRAGPTFAVFAAIIRSTITSFYHYNAMQRWRIDSNGVVHNV